MTKVDEVLTDALWPASMWQKYGQMHMRKTTTTTPSVVAARISDFSVLTFREQLSVTEATWDAMARDWDTTTENTRAYNTTTTETGPRKESTMSAIPAAKLSTTVHWPKQASMPPGFLRLSLNRIPWKMAEQVQHKVTQICSLLCVTVVL